MDEIIFKILEGVVPISTTPDFPTRAARIPILSANLIHFLSFPYFVFLPGQNQPKTTFADKVASSFLSFNKPSGKKILNTTFYPD